MAEQLGLVTTKPPDFFRQACISISLMCPPLTSGITSGTSDCMRSALEFETTAQPASANCGSNSAAIDASRARSEEHTSELQSRQYLVCRLLLEKKKKTIFCSPPDSS